MQILPQDLLAKVEKFLVERDMTATAFGLQSVRDRNFVHRLRSGANMQIRTIDKAYDFLKSQQRSGDAQ